MVLGLIEHLSRLERIIASKDGFLASGFGDPCPGYFTECLCRELDEKITARVNLIEYCIYGCWSISLFESASNCPSSLVIIRFEYHLLTCVRLDYLDFCVAHYIFAS